MKKLSHDELLKHTQTIRGYKAAENRRGSYPDNFKYTICELCLEGVPKKELMEKYELSKSLLNKWIQLHTKGSYKTQRKNLAQEQELKRLEKISNKLTMQYDIILQVVNDLLNNEDKYQLVEKNKEKYSVKRLCETLNLPEETYDKFASKSKTS